MFEKILVPLDMSKMAEQILPVTVDFARAFGSEVHLISICEVHDGQEEETCRNYLNTEAGKLADILGEEKIKTMLVAGSPDQQITRYAQNEKISLILMTSHGRSGVVLWPMGGTVDKVLRRTRTPLLFVRVKEIQETPGSWNLFENILVPLDGSELGAIVVPLVIEIADKFNSRVTLIHVIDTDRRVHSLGRIDTVPFREEELQSLKMRGEGYLKLQAKRFRRTSGPVRTEVRAGNVAEEIIKFAREDNITLIALSSHGHSGFEAWILGSVTSKILHSSNKSILFAPAIAP
ncbi:MAG: universal stress protein [Dehalococcoidales bacterium]|jgi:nucleotide-binding universal stress UspA family protein|nr:universal stress protein [Dehalococcoidales bacterium]